MPTSHRPIRRWTSSPPRLPKRKGVSPLGEPALVTTGGKYVVIYRRVNGQWKIAYDIFNND